MQDPVQLEQKLIKTLSNLVRSLIVMVSLIVMMLILLFYYHLHPEAFSRKENVELADNNKLEINNKPKENYWQAPDTASLAGDPNRDMILYGRDLIARTALYFGPQGTVRAHSTNGLNCQNCHLDAGTRVFGNNYGSVASTYPKYRARSGTIENIYKRVNDCFERSLNGKALDTLSKEMQAIKAYITWLGKDVPKGEKAKGSGLKDLAFLDRAADPEKGKALYAEKCQSCHQPNGEGLMNADKTAYTYPPLWGEHSYNSGAGLFRMSNFAKYVKYNMPLGATHDEPILTDEEAWDIAAFVNSQPRPSINISRDWPKIEEKPFDHPFGPYADQFSEKQHKYGPFKPIIDTMNARKQKQASAKSS